VSGHGGAAGTGGAPIAGSNGVGANAAGTNEGGANSAGGANSTGGANAAGANDAGTSSAGSNDGGMIGAGGAAAGAGGNTNTAGAGDGGAASDCADRVVSTSTFCVDDESVGRGQSTSVAVHLLLPAACSAVTQSSVRIVLPEGVSLTTFNYGSNPDCLHVSGPVTGNVYTVGQLTASASGICPEAIHDGVLLEVELRAAASVAPGSYPLTLRQPQIGDNFTEVECRNREGGAPTPSAPAISATLHVTD
jgi:hypothetical protein